MLSSRNKAFNFKKSKEYKEKQLGIQVAGQALMMFFSLE